MESKRQKNYIPDSPRLKTDLITIESSDHPRKVELPKTGFTPSIKSNNKDKGYDDTRPLNYFLHPWTNSVSGTGYGREYWAYQPNPYQY